MCIHKHVQPDENYTPESKKKYPIAQYANSILNAIEANQCIIIEAETGAGKSTQVVQMLLLGEHYGEEYSDELNSQEGKFTKYDDIIVTCPTRIAANTLANRVSIELGTDIGKTVGYESGYEKLISDSTKVRYTTEGFENLREIHTDPKKMAEKRVLIIDDFGKFGIDVETLIAWVKAIKDHLQEDFLTKIILMAAPGSFDSKQVSDFLDAQTISIPGKMFPINEEIRLPNQFIMTIAEEVKKDHNVLAFVPGKGEINFTINKLNSMNVDAELIPLHGDLTFNAQELALCHYNRPKVIVSTNVAQSSITIDDIDVVVDTGLERHLAMIGGAYTLDIGNISKADQIQRKGRAGRTKSGTYYWCGTIPMDELEDYPTPAIVTGQLDRIVLQLSSVGVDAENVVFLHQPSKEKIVKAKNTLRILSAFDENNQITDDGIKMARIPLGVRYSKMVLEAQKRGVADEVITIAAIQEVGGIKDTKTPYSKYIPGFTPDLLGDLAAFNYAKEENRKFHTPIGIIMKNFDRVLELRTKIYDTLTHIFDNVNNSNKSNKREIEYACAAGLVEFLYERIDGDWYTNPNDKYRRKLNMTSAALPSRFMLGTPKTISLSYRKDGAVKVIYLLSAAMPVQNIEFLDEIAPHLVKENCRKVYDIATNSYYKKIIRTFNGVKIFEDSEKISDNKKRTEILIDWFAKNTQLTRELMNGVFDNLTDNSEYISYPHELHKVLKAVATKYSNSTLEELRQIYKDYLKKCFGQNVPNLSKSKNYKVLLENLSQLG